MVQHVPPTEPDGGVWAGRWLAGAAARGRVLAANLALHPDEPDGGVWAGCWGRLLAGPRPVLHLDSIPQSSH
jgi:hypothetical protein